MKKISFAFTLALFFILFFSFRASAQCKGFAKKICKQELSPYIHDGNYNAAVLTEGEEADMPKTFFADQQYRLIVCGTENLPLIEFQVVDANRNVLFDNRQHKMVKSWDFKLESSQQLKIVVKVPASGQKKAEADITSGCVAIMIGFKDKETSKN
jgi:hypothetical protein